MSDFPLLNLPDHLLQKILAKTDEQSNFRLRRSCHYVHDQIMSRRITVHKRGIFTIYPDGRVLYQLSNTIVFIAPEGIYGARLDTFFLRNLTFDLPFEYIYDILKKFHISCNSFTMERLGFSNEELAALLKLLKPVSVEIDFDSDTLPAILDTPTVQCVSAFLLPENVNDFMKILLTHFPQVKLKTLVSGEESSDIFAQLRESLDDIQSLPSSAKVRKFRYKLNDGPRASEEVLEREFPNLKWNKPTVEETSKRNGATVFSATIPLSATFPLDSSCTFTVKNASYFQTGRQASRTMYIVCYETSNSLEI